MNKCLMLSLLVFNAQICIAQNQPKKERKEIAITQISNLELSYTQTIKRAKPDTSYMVTITMTDVNPITSKALSLGGNKREFWFFSKKTFDAIQENFKKALNILDNKNNISYRGGNSSMDLDTEFDKENNRPRVKMTWKAVGSLESRYTYLYMEDLHKIIAWCSTIDFGSTVLMTAQAPQLKTSLNDEVVKSPTIEKQYKADQTQGGGNSVQLAKITGKWYNLMMRNEYKNGGVESGSTGDYEPIRILDNGTWSYYSKRGKLTIEPFTVRDILEWKMKKDIPQWKLTFHDFSNGDGEGYFTTDALGNAVYVVVKFKIYSPKEGYSLWTQYRRS